MTNEIEGGIGPGDLDEGLSLWAPGSTPLRVKSAHDYSQIDGIRELAERVGVELLRLDVPRVARLDESRRQGLKLWLDALPDLRTEIHLAGVVGAPLEERQTEAGGLREGAGDGLPDRAADAGNRQPGATPSHTLAGGQPQSTTTRSSCPVCGEPLSVRLIDDRQD